MSKNELVKIAAEMVRMKNMPSPYREDWNKRFSWLEYEARMEKAEAQIKEWAMKIIAISECHVKIVYDTATEINCGPIGLDRTTTGPLDNQEELDRNR